MSEFVLELRDITKQFPGVIALDNIKFQLKKGETHALMGENGAGKSTLIKIITGVHHADKGEMILNREPVVFQNTNDSLANSIAAIYQHSTAYPYLSVTENIFIGHEITTNQGFVRWRQMHKQSKSLLESLGSNIDPHTLMGNLSVAEQQIVEIAKAVSSNASILIMDEPTAALSTRECDEFYRITEQLKAEGKSIIFVSHRLEDMYRLADRVTVFRDAKYIGTWDIGEVTNEILIKAMVGREIQKLYPKQEAKIGKDVLEVENLTKVGFFNNVSFSVRAGEIFGLTGLVGAGRSDVVQAICGITKADSGKVKLDGKEVNFTHPIQSIKQKLGYLPEDRQIQGLLLPWEIYKNQSLPVLDRYTDITGISIAKEREDSVNLIKKYSIKASGVFDKASSLSGGNQQKVVVSKLLNLDMKVLIMDEPTKGVDVGAKAQMYEIISNLAQKGYGIILISSEMPEVLAMSDRIGVMHEGRLMEIFDTKNVTQEQILAVAMNSTPVIAEETEGLQ